MLGECTQCQGPKPADDGLKSCESCRFLWRKYKPRSAKAITEAQLRLAIKGLKEIAAGVQGFSDSPQEKALKILDEIGREGGL